MIARLDGSILWRLRWWMMAVMSAQPPLPLAPAADGRLVGRPAAIAEDD